MVGGVIMANNTAIEWTQATWNPVTGCSKISTGCLNCYAERMAKRLKAMGNSRYLNGFGVTLHPDLLTLPLSWKKPRSIFVNSMSDLFHDEVPAEFVREVFSVMNRAQHHRFQILTKRADRMAQMAEELSWTPNILMGVTVEDQEAAHRVSLLRQVPAAVRFLSVEPLLGPIERLDLAGIGWVIVGGESGPGARPMEPEWVYSIRETCIRDQVPFFFKQWGGVQKHKHGRVLQGKIWEEVPSIMIADD
jgi:protein gp37